MARAEFGWQFQNGSRPGRKLDPDAERSLAHENAKLERRYSHHLGGHDLHYVGERGIHSA